MDIDYWQIHMYNFFAHFWLQHINGLNIVQKKEEEEQEEEQENKVYLQCWDTTMCWPEVISGGYDIFNYNSLILIQKYLNSLTPNTGDFWVECGNGKLKLLPQQ